MLLLDLLLLLIRLLVLLSNIGIIVILLRLLTWLAVDVLEGEFGDVHLLFLDENLGALIAAL